MIIRFAFVRQPKRKGCTDRCGFALYLVFGSRYLSSDVSARLGRTQTNGGEAACARLRRSSLYVRSDLLFHLLVHQSRTVSNGLSYRDEPACTRLTRTSFTHGAKECYLQSALISAKPVSMWSCRLITNCVIVASLTARKDLLSSVFG